MILRITVDVKAGSKTESIEEIGPNHYLIHVKAPRSKGKANVAVTKILKKHLGGYVELVRGHTSTRKIFESIE